MKLGNTMCMPFCCDDCVYVKEVGPRYSIITVFEPMYFLSFIIFSRAKMLCFFLFLHFACIYIIFYVNDEPVSKCCFISFTIYNYKQYCLFINIYEFTFVLDP